MATHISRQLAQQIVDTVKDVCGRDINFIEPSGIILASTDARRTGEFHEIGQKTAAAGETIEVAEGSSFAGTQEGVNMPVFHQGVLTAVIGITGPPEQVRAFGYLAVRITLLLIREQEVADLARSRQEKIRYIVRSLIWPEGGASSLPAEALAEFHIDPDKKMLACDIRLNEQYHPANISLIEHNLNQLFQALGIQLACYEYPRGYIALLPEETCAACRSRLAGYAEEQPQGFTIGLGSPQPLSRLSLSYREALIARGSLKLSGKAFADFRDLDLEILLAGVEPDCRQVYLEKTVASLSPRQRRLLQVYYEEDMSLTETGRRLFLHKNTLQYQLNKIHRDTGYNPRRFCDAAVLYLGLFIGSQEISSP